MGNIITPNPSFTSLITTDLVKYDVTNSRLQELLNHILALNTHHAAALVHDGLLTLNNNLKLKDVDATPVGDLLLKVIDQILYIRNSGDSANQKIAIECLLTAVANGLATLDSNVRLAQAANTAWDGTAARSFSPTPAANTVPVSDATKGILFGHSDGTNHIKTKIIEIGDWDMDATVFVTIAHGVTFSKFRSAGAMIRNDANDRYYIADNSTVANGLSIGQIDSTNIQIVRNTASLFDSIDFNSTSYNRGWITITYVE